MDESGKTKKSVELSRKICPCDTSRPYAFISYSRADHIRVWSDVCRLQEMGYNVWIDLNLKVTEGSWKKALERISDFECMLVVFYISENSVISAPCLEELRRRQEQATRNTHNGEEVPMIGIEVEPVGDVKGFRDRTYQKIRFGSLGAGKNKNETSSTLTQLMDENYPDNDILRILGEQDTNRRTDYFGDITRYFDDCGVSRRSPEEAKKALQREQYRGALALLDGPAPNDAEAALAECSNGEYPEATLLLYFLYATGAFGEEKRAQADGMMFFAILQCGEADPAAWFKKAGSAIEQKEFEEAAAWYAASGCAGGAQGDGAKAFVEATRMAMIMQNLYLARRFSEEAARRGSKDGAKLFAGFRSQTRETFLNMTDKYARRFGRGR